MEIPDIGEVVPASNRFPFCVIWTPIPVITWFIPIIGHMGIANSTGVIRDFAGSHYVSEDDMEFGKPTKYWQLKPSLAIGGVCGWDHAVDEATEMFKKKSYKCLFDNCYSYVATALNIMHYKKSNHWNMVKLVIVMLIYSKYVSFLGFIKTWMPFISIFLVTISSYMYCKFMEISLF